MAKQAKFSEPYFNSPKRTTKDIQHSTEKPLKSSLAKRTEYSQNVGAYSPIRHIGNSNTTRMSFQSQSPTRYDEIASANSPFDQAKR